MRILNGVYLLHMEPTWHYVGCSMDIARRLHDHTQKTGNGYVQRMVGNGFDAHLVRVWDGESFDFEKALKRKGRFKNLCPICLMRKEAVQTEVIIDEELIESMGGELHQPREPESEEEETDE